MLLRRLLACFALLTLVALPAAALAGKPVCGDGKVRGGEDCDGSNLDGATCTSLGFDGGDLACDASCSFDTSGCTTSVDPVCGDGVVDGYEECDGAADSACPGLCSDHCACPAAAPGDLELHYLDVGQGDAIVVVSPDGFVMLADSGTEGNAAAISAYLVGAGLGGLDYTLVSHMHDDHMGAMDVVLDDHPETVACFDHGAAFSTIEFDEYALAAAGRRVEVTPGGTIDMGPSVTVDVLHSDTGDSAENLNSVVFRVTHGSLAFLIGGDCESPCEARFNPGKIEVYKVHHHGASDSSSDAMLDQMDPYTAVISVGAGNPYGHPDADTLSRLTAWGADIWRTDLDGNVVVVSDGSTYTVNGTAVCSDGATRACGASDVGACEYGTRTCAGGFWGECLGEVTPVAEDCGNGIDDDCDGLTDGDDSDCSSPLDYLVISQVAYDTPGTDSLEEFVDLHNPGTTAVSLDGWSLADAAGSWSFPAGVTVEPGAFVSVARDAAGFSALYGKDADVEGLTLSLNNDGDALWLRDGGGSDVDHVAWEGFEPGWTIAAAIGDSIERIDPAADTDQPTDWATTSPATPRGGSEVIDDCGNGTCDAGEDCISCPSDCVGRTGGKPSKRFCCGNGACEPVGEDADVCPIDCP